LTPAEYFAYGKLFACLSMTVRLMIVPPSTIDNYTGNDINKTISRNTSHMSKHFTNPGHVSELKDVISQLHHFLIKSDEHANKAVRGPEKGKTRASRKFREYSEKRTDQIDKLHGLLGEFGYVPKRSADTE
jgi:hypothetical protein